MSQNKTVFPGIGPDADQNPLYQQPMGAGNYSRPANLRGHGTVYPGMENFANQMPGEPQQGRQAAQSGKPIVGFLYSISRTAVGEFWPIHVGQNVIGSASDCDIQLNEATVSQHHAILHVNKMKKPEKIEATISDSQSTNGTMVNGNSVSVARPPECVNGDIITIGENYEFLFILIDVKAVGLQVSANFIATQAEAADIAAQEQPFFAQRQPGQTVNQQDFPPRFNGPGSAYSNPHIQDGTVGMDPGSSNFSGGGTVGMD